MVVVVAEGVSVATAVVQHPSHALAWVLMHEEHGVHGHTHDALHAHQALGAAGLGRCRQLQLQLAHAGQEGAGFTLAPKAAIRAPHASCLPAPGNGRSAARAARGAASGSARGAARGTTAAGGAAGGGGAASAASAAATAPAIAEVHARMVAWTWSTLELKRWSGA